MKPNKTTQTKIRIIRVGDPKWFIPEGAVIYPRAGFEIDPRCPPADAHLIQHAIGMGWVKPVAYLIDHELMWEELSK